MAPVYQWSMGVGLLLGLATGAVPQVDGPHVAGVGLGVTAPVVQQVLGRPDRQEGSLGMQFWDYQGRGVTVIWRESEPGVHAIVANRAAAGAVRGVKVGDSQTTLRRQWGTPARVRQDGRFWDFVGAGWVLSAELQERKVVQITLMAASAATH
jgi:hypothetical protein